MLRILEFFADLLLVTVILIFHVMISKLIIKHIVVVVLGLIFRIIFRIAFEIILNLEVLTHKASLVDLLVDLV